MSEAMGRMADDPQLKALLIAFADEAVGGYDTNAVAQAAIAARYAPGLLGSVRALSANRAWRLALLAALVMLAALVVGLAVGAIRLGSEAVIVVARSGELFVAHGFDDQLVGLDPNPTEVGEYQWPSLSRDGSAVLASFDTSIVDPETSVIDVRALDLSGRLVNHFESHTVVNAAAWAGGHRFLVMPAGRSNAAKLYVFDGDSPTPMDARLPAGFISYEPWVDVSPDGRRALIHGCVCPYTQPMLWSIALDGSSMREVGGGRQPVFAGAWSPDGTEIAYQTTAPGATLDIVKEVIFRAPASGGPGTEVATVDGVVSNLAWSPDERNIAFVVFAGTESRLGILSLNSAPLNVGPVMADLDGTVWPERLRWTPDSSQVFFLGTPVDASAPAMRRFDLATHTSTTVIGGVDGFDVTWH